jgi:PAS domain S-box-containing protein
MAAHGVSRAADVAAASADIVLSTLHGVKRVTSHHPERPGAGPDPAHRYRRTLDNLLVGVQIIAFDWTYIYLNPAAAAHGHRPRGLVGQRIYDAYPGIEHTPLFQRLRACMEERTRQVFENLFTFPDGTTRWFDIRVEPVEEGICVYSFDIHERKMAQLALERRTAELESKLPLLRRIIASLKGT